MKIRILIVLIILFAGIAVSLSAQQNVQYTQLTYNKLFMNTGYAGGHDIGCVQVNVQNQWIEFHGAPKSESANFNTPLFRDKVVVSISINHDELRPTDNYFASLNYSYRVPAKNRILPIVLQKSLSNINVNFTKLNPRKYST